jgi:hypothetical protein
VKKSAKPAADEGKESHQAKKGAAAARQRHRKKAKKELPAGFGPREIPEGHTGLAALAEAAGRSPRLPRVASCAPTRSAKPEGQHGWYWKDGSKDLKKVAELLAKEGRSRGLIPRRPCCKSQPAPAGFFLRS